MTNAHALSPIPEPIQIDLGDGLVFHLTPYQFIDQGYPKSGLYRNGELLYTFNDNNDWRRWLWFDELFFSDDAMSFFSVPRYVGPNNLNGRVICYYSKGVLMHDIKIVGHLISLDSEAFDEPDQFTGLSMWLITSHHDRANNKIEVITIEGYKITFDLSSGTVLSKEISPEHVPPELQSEQNIMAKVLIASVLLIFSVVVFYLFRKQYYIKKLTHKTNQ